METAVTRQGKLLGKNMGDYTAFYSVPYARPPVGRLRFCPPEAPENYSGERDARTPRARPYQPFQPLDTPCGREFYFDPGYLPPMSEDCLSVHIWTPAETPGEKLPVAFWIHGGAFCKGFGTEVEFDGAGFCRRGVVFVSAEYRLGVFGFLCHPALAAEGGGHCGNYGLLDQLAALRWVRENIGAFGGDPEKITVMGQSAGAMSVQALASSPLAEGLFRGAVLQSAGGYRSPLAVNTVQSEAEEDGVRFAGLCGAKSFSRLRSLPPEALLESFSRFQPLSGRLPFAPVKDGYVIPDFLDDAAEKGAHRDIPYLLGANADDLGTVPGGGENPLLDAMVGFSRLNAGLGRTPAYVYCFRRVPPGNDQGTYYGSYHSAEMWYVFETCSRSWRPFGPGDRDLSSRMADCWCRFVKTGDPNGGSCDWRPCRGKDDVMTFDVGPDRP